jgi:hypothetical protein
VAGVAAFARELSARKVLSVTRNKSQTDALAIPPHLRKVFREAVWLYAEWSPALAEPQVRLDNRLRDISAICALVETFRDPLPEEIFERLMSYMREIRYTLIRQKLVAERSYSSAGRCFLRLIEDRKRHFLAP